MKKMIPLWAILLLAFSQAGFSAGGPMNEDLSTLLPGAQKAVEAGKKGDSSGFTQEVKALFEEAKGHPVSAKQQRILSNMRTALAKSKAGNLEDATKMVESAISNMTQSAPPKFGGGS